MNNLIKETKKFILTELNEGLSFEDFQKQFHQLEEEYKTSKEFVNKDFEHSKIKSYWLVDDSSIRPLYEVSFYEAKKKDLYTITLESRDKNLSISVKKFNLHY